MTTPAETAELLAATFPGVTAGGAGTTDPFADVPAELWEAVARFLKTDPRCRFDLLNDLSATDYFEPDAKKAPKAGFEPHVEVKLHLSSFAEPGRRCGVKVRLPRGTPDAPPELPSLAAVWPAADWHEREAYDMVGVRFVGHPDQRRILLADDWVGHPLRKDYEFPLEYHGIRCR